MGNLLISLNLVHANKSRLKVDLGSKVLAGQDFRHTMQKETESVADFIRRLECVFQIAYGHYNDSLWPIAGGLAFGVD